MELKDFMDKVKNGELESSLKDAEAKLDAIVAMIGLSGDPGLKSQLPDLYKVQALIANLRESTSNISKTLGSLGGIAKLFKK